MLPVDHIEDTLYEMSAPEGIIHYLVGQREELYNESVRPGRYHLF